MKLRQGFWVVLMVTSTVFTSVCFATQSRSQGNISASSQGAMVNKASAFIGSSVYGPQGEKLGTIDDLVIDPQTGQTMYAALSYGAILGFGGKLVAIPWNALTLAPDGQSVVLHGLDKDALAEAPGFDKDNWPPRADALVRASILRANDTEARDPEPADTPPGQAMSALVERINAEEGSVTFRSKDGNAVDLRVPAELLVGLQVGDTVQVKATDETVTAIEKRETAQPSASGAQELPHSAPFGSSKSP